MLTSPTPPLRDVTRTTEELLEIQRHCQCTCRENYRLLALPDGRRSLLQLLSRLIPAMVVVSIAIRWRSTIALVGAGAVCATLWASLVAAVFHDSSHRLAAKTAGGNRCLGTIAAAPFGLSLDWWKIEHAVLHHRNVGSARDPDIQFWPLARVTRSSPWKPWYRYQHIYLFAFYPLALLQMLAPSDVRHMWRGHTRADGVFSRIVGWRLIGTVLWKYVPFFAFWTSLLLILGRFRTVVLFADYFLVGGLLFSLMVHIQHNNDRTVQRATCDDGLNLQLGQTVDVASNGRLWSFLAGHTNHHLTHHLFPAIPNYNLPAMTGLLRVELREAGLEYPEFRSLTSAIAGHYRLLRLLSRFGYDPSEAKGP